MKLYFMKQSALDYMKVNMGSLYKNYYQFNSPDWIYDLFDYDPFEIFDIVDDFELANLNLQLGEIDLQNSRILYSKLRNLTDSQASDERLWAGLSNKTFYGYLRERWKYSNQHLKKSAKDSSAILTRYFYNSSGRSGMFRNTLAKCWWTGRLTYSEKYTDRWELLDAIGPEDLASKISDIFYSYTYSSNSDIVEGFCQGLKFFRDRGIFVSSREHIRPTAQYLNALGGALLLDMFSSDEIKTFVVEFMGKLIRGVDTGIIAEIYDSTDDAREAEDIMNNSDAEEVNVDFGEFMDLLEQTHEIDIDSVLGELTEVEYGCKIYIKKLPDNKFYTSYVPLAGEKMNSLQKYFLGKPIGSVRKYANSTYEVIDIRRQ